MVEMIELSEICKFVKGKINISSLNLDNYISTENMLPNKEGVVKSSSLPSLEQTQIYKEDDVLVSNIRPYFKKIWLADTNGGCSNDVLVFRAKEEYNSRFLYYVLSDDKFFSYATGTSKGTKMPRGDKQAIMRYKVPKFSVDKQIKIVKILGIIDDKIKLNEMINRNLLNVALRSRLFKYQCLRHQVHLT
jgi:type I restriction enzyme S subunit